jgi:ATP-dependent Clp endopeptidase proteolytic subunit ClpP
MNRRGEYRIRNAAESVTEVLVYDVIGEDPWFGGGISAKRFTEDLADIDTDEIHLRINSPGGDVFEGIAILNALKRHPAKVTAYVDGIAASAASFIAMAGEQVVMSRNAEMMIHDASGIVIGRAEEMEKMADDLNRVSDNIASIYADRAGGTTSQWRKAMKDETWYSDKEAVKAGLADRVETNKTAGEKTKNRFNFAAYNYAGRAEAPDPYLPAEPPGTPTNQEGSDMSDTLIEGLRERLGLSADADESAITAALDAALTNTVTPDDPDDAPETDDENEDETDADEPGEKPGSEPQAPGTVTVDSDQFENLRRDAEAGRRAFEAQEQQRRENLVDAAIRDGRVSPARRNDWLSTLKNDKGAEASLAGLAKGLIPVDGPQGYTGGLAEAAEDDAVYNKLFGNEKAGV